MRNIHRFLAGLLALCLLWTPALAAGQDPVLTWRQEGGGIVLTLKGLEDKLSALQAELTLEGECPDASFTPASRDVYSPDCQAEAGRGQTTVTICLTAEGDSLMEGRSLSLGTLYPGGSCTLPARASLVLLDRSLRPLEGGSIRVQLREDTGSGSGGGSSSGSRPLRRVRTAETEHGSLSVRPSSAAEGATVTITPLPDSGYVLDSLTVTDSQGRSIRTVSAAARSYTFTMPGRDVEVKAVFAPGDGSLPFLDIEPGAWCYDAVRRVYEMGLMNGTSATTFTPNAATNRGMIVAILYRLEGSPAAGSSGFSDVAPGAYYASAVAWAVQNGIVNGYDDNTFRPGNRITREQLAAFLYRYVRYKGGDVSDRADLSAFTDAGQIASYAVEPLQWANAQGLVNGTSAATLSPGGSATRAQAAVILTRLMENVL